MKKVLISESQLNYLKESVNGNNVLSKTWICYGIEEFDKNKFKTITSNPYAVLDNQFTNKPGRCGLWACPVFSDNDWVKFSSENDFYTENLNKHLLFRLKPKSKIYTIDNVEDLAEISTLQYNNISIRYYFTIDYFRLIQEGFDGIYVTDKGSGMRTDIVIPKPVYLDGESFPISKERIIRGLDCWDVESICVLNPNAIEIIQEDEELKNSINDYTNEKIKRYPNWW